VRGVAVKVPGGTWLSTVLFTCIFTVIWMIWLGWNAARVSILWIIILCQTLWWWVVGDSKTRRALRGAAAGALIGPVTQVLPQAAPMFMVVLLRRNSLDGDSGLVVGASAVAYIMLGVGTVIVGALVGLLTVMVEPRVAREGGSVPARRVGRVGPL